MESRIKCRDVTINTCNARHELALLKEVILQQNQLGNNWKEQHLKDKTKNVDIFWLAGPEKEQSSEMI